MHDKDAADYANMKAVLDSFPDVKMITVDVANAYHENFIDCINTVRDEFPNKIILAGNVVTAEMVEELIINGADIVTDWYWSWISVYYTNNDWCWCSAI